MIRSLLVLSFLFLGACAHNSTPDASASDVAAKPEPRDIVVTRTFSAPVAKVWKAWTKPTQLAKWWGPADYTSPTNKIDFKVGGKYLTSMKSPAGETFYSAGTYTKITPQKSFEVEDTFADAQGNAVPPTHYRLPAEMPATTHMKVDFHKEKGNKTTVTVTAYAQPSGPTYDQAVQGWNESFDKLATFLK